MFSLSPSAFSHSLAAAAPPPLSFPASAPFVFLSSSCPSNGVCLRVPVPVQRFFEWLAAYPGEVVMLALQIDWSGRADVALMAAGTEPLVPVEKRSVHILNVFAEKVPDCERGGGRGEGLPGRQSRGDTLATQWPAPPPSLATLAPTLELTMSGLVGR
eukprot:GHVU01200237.1.p1 GENE.GHVU01200237.1~~GHVU01200237.1.p1  ORF type:complete len:158 (+),score=14.61 GHVU01200237.1:333-806(+)